MTIRLLLIFSYIIFCIRLRVTPKKYFQLNSIYFNEQRNIFSKLEMDKLIPEKWRLKQFLDLGHQLPDQFPVFIKPEWGQNSRGVQRANNIQQLESIRRRRKESNINYLIQEAAPGKNEFEIFTIPSIGKTPAGIDTKRQPAIMSVTETLNSSNDRFPINGIYNKTTSYCDITDLLTASHLQKLWGYLADIGQFRIARFGIRADSLEDLLQGRFHIIEINLFLPMPLILLAKNKSWRQKIRFSLDCMWQLARVTQTLPASHPNKPVFFKKLKLSRSLKVANDMKSYDEHA